MSSHADRPLLEERQEFRDTIAALLAERDMLRRSLELEMAKNQQLREALRWIGTCYESPEQSVAIIAAYARGALAAVGEE